MKAKKLLAIISAAAISVGVSQTSAQEVQTGIFKVAKGASQKIDRFGVCKVIKNTSANPIMVPAGSKAQWSTGAGSFLNNTANMTGVAVQECLEACYVEREPAWGYYFDAANRYDETTYDHFFTLYETAWKWHGTSYWTYDWSAFHDIGGGNRISARVMPRSSSAPSQSWNYEHKPIYAVNGSCNPVTDSAHRITTDQFADSACKSRPGTTFCGGRNERGSAALLSRIGSVDLTDAALEIDYFAEGKIPVCLTISNGVQGEARWNRFTTPGSAYSTILSASNERNPNPVPQLSSYYSSHYPDTLYMFPDGYDECVIADVGYPEEKYIIPNLDDTPPARTVDTIILRLFRR